MGGSAGVGVLLLAAIPSTTLAVASLVVLAALHGRLDDSGDDRLRRDARRASGQLVRVAVPAFGSAGLAFGFWYAAAAWSLMPYPF